MIGLIRAKEMVDKSLEEWVQGDRGKKDLK